jgi:hypothetical protein
MPWVCALCCRDSGYQYLERAEITEFGHITGPAT